MNKHAVPGLIFPRTSPTHSPGANVSEAFADGGNDAPEGFERAVRTVAVGGAQFGPEGDVGAEAVERQVTVVGL